MIFLISKWFFLLLIVSLPLVRPFNTSLFGLLVPFTDFIFLGAFGFWIIAVLRGETKLKFSKLYFFLAFYAFALTLSTIFSTDLSRSFYKLLGEFYLILLCVLTFNLMKSFDFLKRVTQAWLIGTFLTVLASLAGIVLFYLDHKTQIDNYFLSHFGSLPEGNYPRLRAFFVNANMMCNFLNVSLFLTLLAEKLEWLKKTWARILQFGIWFAAFFTLSPGLGGLLLSSGIWWWANLSFGKRKTFALSALAAGILLALVFLSVTLVSLNTSNTNQDFHLPFIEQKVEPSVRVLIWQNSLETIKKYPFLGKGTGANVVFVPYQTLSGDSQLLLDAHNIWLNLIGQIGFFGFIAFVCLSIFLLRRCRFYLADNSEKPHIQLALSCAFIGAFLYQGLQGSFEDARHLWVLFGLTLSFGEKDLTQNQN